MLQTCEAPSSQVIEFEGRMDTMKCTQIEADLRALLAQPDVPVVFDLDRVEFVSSAFLRLCIYAARSAGDHGFQIVNANPSIKRVFKIAGLDNMLHKDDRQLE